MRIQKKSCFTLLEVLVSMGVFSLLMLALMQFFSAAQGVWEKTGTRAEMFDSARIAMETLAADLSSAYYQNDFDATQIQYFAYDESNLPGKVVFAAQLEDGNAEICYSWDNGTLYRKVLKENGDETNGSPFKDVANPSWFTRIQAKPGTGFRTWVTNVAVNGDTILENILAFSLTVYDKSGTKLTEVPKTEGGYIQIPYMVRIQVVVVSSDALEKLANRGKANLSDVITFYKNTSGLSEKILKGTPPNDNDADTDEMILFKGCQVFNRAVVIDRGQY